MNDALETTLRAHLSSSKIREFWTTQANRHGQSHAASWSDRHAIELECATISKYLQDGDRILDLGWRNGASTLELARQHNIEIRGLDYIPEMIRQAEANLAELSSRTIVRASFGVGDITQLQEPDGCYDKTIVIRVIINLADREMQAEGLRQAAHTVKPGGLLLLSEATLQGWGRLNEFRREWGLEDLPMPDFNLYLDEDAVAETLEDEMELLEINNFASSYFVGTRVMKPLMAKLVDRESEIANPETHWNRWCANLPPAGDYGTQKLFVFRKK